MTLAVITHAERARWQRRAAAKLAAILDTYRDLPVIGSTIGPAGATLVGHVNGLAPAAQVRQVLTIWRVALVLDDKYSETPVGAGTVFLRAVACCDRVHVCLTATVFGEAAGQAEA